MPHTTADGGGGAADVSAMAASAVSAYELMLEGSSAPPESEPQQSVLLSTVQRQLGALGLAMVI